MLWVWYKPATAPQDVYLQVPPETLGATGGVITLRLLCGAAGLPVEEIQLWSINNVPVVSSAQSLGLLDQPLTWLAGPIVVRMNGPLASGYVPAATPPASGDSELVYQRIESDWNVIQQIESNMGQLRKQLHGMAGKLKSLDRDLNPDEVRAADSQEKREWQDIRRWIRDAAAGVSRAIREFDVGDVSAAGSRGRFEELYRDQVAPRRAMQPQMLASEFELYRKLVQSQFQKMQTASQAGSRDGEQRAQTFLSRIAAKVRNQRHQRGR
ncbi:MAG: hypothetical protein KDA90_01080 [Planctomycetaceae bacterium]|nr:hypothetical protein [Planctomycetaceae bacterium]